MKTVLVTGGAGYIGSHAVQKLFDAGYSPVVLDNLYSGNREAVGAAPLVVGDVGDERCVRKILENYDIESVLHFAAHTVVPESVADPLKYYRNNTANSRALLECCHNHGVKHFVFSSTAAVYGIPEEASANEDSSISPINPYGQSKWMTECMIRDLSAVTEMRHLILRYFNVAGCDSQGRIGQSTPNATLLVKVACEAAVGKRDGVSIFGTDFDTVDGTGVRDYIHVEDLAQAHINGLEYLENGGESTTLNCGYGHGYSVRQVLDMVEEVSGLTLKITETERRAGDPPILIAEAERIRNTLAWQPQLDDLRKIVESSLLWEKKLVTRRKAS